MQVSLNVRPQNTTVVFYADQFKYRIRIFFNFLNHPNTMAIMKCRECGNKVSSEAATCPHCGVSNPVKVIAKAASAPPAKIGMSIWKKVGIGLLVLWIIGFVSQMGQKKTSNPPTSAEATGALSSTPSNNLSTPDGGAQCFNKL